MNTERIKMTPPPENGGQETTDEAQPTGDENQQTPVNANAFVTQEQFKAFTDMASVTAKTLETVQETMAALQEVLSSEKTDAENQEAVGKQLKDAKRINHKNKVAIQHTETFDSNILFKGITENTPEDEAMEIVTKTFTLPTEAEVIQTWQRKLTEIKILSEFLGKKPEDLNAWKSYETFIDETGIKAIINRAGAPDNYIPVGWSNELLQYFYQELEVAALFMEFTMPQNPYDWKLLGRPKAVRYIERTDANAVRGTGDPTPQKPRQGNIRFDAEVMMVPCQITEEFREDALMTYMDELIRVHIPGASAEALESTIINGDRADTHQDNGYTDVDVETCFDGIRKIAKETGAIVDGSTYNFSLFAKVIRRGGKWTVKKRDGAWIMSNSAYTQCLDFDPVKTLDKHPMPTNVQGAVNVIHGRPVIVSGEYPEDLNDEGVVSATVGDNTKTGFTHVNRGQFRIGTVREERVEREWDMRLQSHVIVATCRRDFQAMEDRKGRTDYTPAVSATKITSAP